MQPLLDEAAGIKAAVVDLKEQLKRLKKEKVDPEKLNVLHEQILEKDKAAKDLENKAAGIDAAVFDLKAVNPNAVTKVDKRSPQDIIGSIEQLGRTISEAMARLTALLAENACNPDKRPGGGGAKGKQ